MITFDAGDVRFIHRVGGIAVQDGRVLLMQAEEDNSWFTPGGRIELMEPAVSALRREMQEELGVTVEVGRLLWVVENFFEWMGHRQQEVGLYFEMAVPPERGPLHGPFVAMEGEQQIPCVWQPLSEVARLSIVPSFLQEALTDLPETPVHVVHVDPPKAQHFATEGVLILGISRRLLAWRLRANEPKKGCGTAPATRTTFLVTIKAIGQITSSEKSRLPTEQWSPSTTF